MSLVSNEEGSGKQPLKFAREEIGERRKDRLKVKG